MARILDWIKERENSFFLTHLLAVLVLAILVEQLASGWTTYSFPALILLSAASFMWNYPVKAIKSHGVFSEYLIELRLLWLVIIGLLFEYFVFGLFESKASAIPAVAAFIAGMLVIFFSRNRLQERLVKERGFK